jgi:hypothetical protein
MKLSLKKKLKKLVNKSAKKKASKMVAKKEASMNVLNSAIGADVITFTDLTAAVLTATARPQRAFRLTKLVVDPVLNAAAVAAGVAVVVDQIRCGMENLFSANASLPATNFRPDSIGNYLKSEFIDPGQEVSIQYRVVGVMPLDGSVIVSSGLFGDSKEK